jgi:hypothetical protein
MDNHFGKALAISRCMTNTSTDHKFPICALRMPAGKFPPDDRKKRSQKEFFLDVFLKTSLIISPRVTAMINFQAQPGSSCAGLVIAGNNGKSTPGNSLMWQPDGISSRRCKIQGNALNTTCILPVNQLQNLRHHVLVNSIMT